MPAPCLARALHQRSAHARLHLALSDCPVARLLLLQRFLGHFEQKVAPSHPSWTGGRRDRPGADSLEGPTRLRGPPIGLLLLLPPPSVEPGGESEGGGGEEAAFPDAAGKGFFSIRATELTRPSSAGETAVPFPRVSPPWEWKGAVALARDPSGRFRIPVRGRKAELSKRRGFPAQRSRFGASPGADGARPPPSPPLLVFSPGWDGFGQGRQEKTLPTDLLGPADFCPGEDVRADEILGRSGKSAPRLLAGDDGKSSQGRALLASGAPSSAFRRSNNSKAGSDRGREGQTAEQVAKF